MAILLAPMEGLLDFALRDVLTRVGGISLCVSEFIRVTDSVLPERVFLRVVPELAHGARTPAGVPVRAQLLGSDASVLADNAARLATLGPAGIDLNFGCPAKVVNRHGGGAALLQDPEQLQRIVAAVRRAVPPSMPVSAKMRLGFDDDAQAEDCARAIAAGGADSLVVHARTKAQGYRPPAYWDRIADICAVVDIPVVANGEIWSVDDARRCIAASGCRDLMLGRGIVADPGLALAILADQAGPGAHGHVAAPTWADLVPLLLHFWQINTGHIDPRARAGRMKQWLNFLRRRHAQAENAYAVLRTINDAREMQAWLQAHLTAPPAAPQPAGTGREAVSGDAGSESSDGASAEDLACAC
jgi:tRNA-dihydrouridine synthase C